MVNALIQWNREEYTALELVKQGQVALEVLNNFLCVMPDMT